MNEDGFRGFITRRPTLCRSCTTAQPIGPSGMCQECRDSHVRALVAFGWMLAISIEKEVQCAYRIRSRSIRDAFLEGADRREQWLARFPAPADVIDGGGAHDVVTIDIGWRSGGAALLVRGPVEERQPWPAADEKLEKSPPEWAD